MGGGPTVGAVTRLLHRRRKAKARLGRHLVLHPGEKQIRGVFTASDMPVVFFDYTTRFEGDTMVNDLRAYGANGFETLYVETWDFTDDTHYVWRLLKKTPDGLQEEMGGTYSKK
jgi:hypothetical protein